MQEIMHPLWVNHNSNLWPLLTSSKWPHLSKFMRSPNHTHKASPSNMDQMDSLFSTKWHHPNSQELS